ncbi:hypothetical protein [Brevibacillus porteri]|uniref:hypothetical protein n=1 Tax=Brevibacillus porteri TaxID=2126350 RepID=UPI002E22F5CC|nr:hypothetical protein [Brevibacillus porteri]MED2129373.1 hypothetical protein [Brevibacillus porteri]MED2896833.1 hypothetical protein [Brevibacillus porteri]
MIKILYRDPSVGDTVLVATVKGKVSDLLQPDKFQPKSEINKYLNNLLHPDAIPYSCIYHHS